jgi:hypothetical protein
VNCNDHRALAWAEEVEWSEDQRKAETQKKVEESKEGKADDQKRAGGIIVYEFATKKKRILISTDIGSSEYISLAFHPKDDGKDNKILMSLVNNLEPSSITKRLSILSLLFLI